MFPPRLSFSLFLSSYIFISNALYFLLYLPFYTLSLFLYHSLSLSLSYPLFLAPTLILPIPSSSRFLDPTLTLPIPLSVCVSARYSCSSLTFNPIPSFFWMTIVVTVIFSTLFLSFFPQLLFLNLILHAPSYFFRRRVESGDAETKKSGYGRACRDREGRE